MHIAVIGGTGHLGSYLVPQLVEMGMTVTVVAWGDQKPYHTHYAWKHVRVVERDRKKLEAEGTFGRYIRSLQPDVVVDLICFNKAGAQQMAEALQGNVDQYLFCGSIWVHGPSASVPTLETTVRNPIDQYGINKADAESYLLAVSRRTGFPATIIHPGHITGEGWIPINPVGNRNLEVFAKLKHGEELVLPNYGMETLHHVHADDLAQIFTLAILNRTRSVGESFHGTSDAALTLRGYAEKVACWFNQTPKLSFAPYEEWSKDYTEEEAKTSYFHIARSSNCSNQKARDILGFEPRYSAERALYESINWLDKNGKIR